MTETKRLDYLDMAKGLGMLFVLIGHLQGERIFTLSPYIQPLCVWIFSFHMPLFFIISGILIFEKSGEDLPLSVHISKRFRSIMIPYYWFSFFYILVVIYALIRGTIQPDTLFVNLWYILSGYGMNVLWFLPALFLGEILFIFLKQRLHARLFPIVLIIISVIGFVFSFLLTFMNRDISWMERIHELLTVLIRPLIVSGFIGIGYYTHYFVTTNKNILSVKERMLSSKPQRTIFYIFSGILMMVLCRFFCVINNGIDFRSLAFRNIPAFLICALLGSFGLILLCKGLPKIRLLCFWGIGSLTFMAVHNSETILHLALTFSMYLNQYLTRARGYICYAVILFIILIYTSLMIVVIRKFFPFILGKPVAHRKK